MQAWLRGLGRWPLVGIAATGGIAMGTAVPPHGAAVLAWCGFAPLAIAARCVGASSVRRAFGLGWVGGLGVGLFGFPWIALTLERFAGAPPLLAAVGLFGFAAWTAIPYGLWALGVARGPRGTSLGVAWAVALWVALSWGWPALFPYTPVIGLAQVPAWIQAAEIGGVGLVEGLVVACGVLLADGVLAVRSGDRLRWIGGAIAIPVVVGGLGVLRMRTLAAEAEAAPRVRFGVVQPNTPLFLPNRFGKLDRLYAQSEAAERAGAQVVVWPEAGVFPFVMRRPYLRDERGLRRVLARHRLPTVFGVATRSNESPYDWNSVAAMASDGRVIGLFDKNELVPFGEFVPLVDPAWARRLIPAMSHNNAGEGPARFAIDPAPTEAQPRPATVHLGPLICYEDIFAGFAREVAGQAGGIEVFVNLTIDTWFGDTEEPWEHLALAQFRSVEHRIPMVRSVAAGPSSVVDSTGRVVAALDVTDPGLDLAVPAAHLIVDVALPRNTAERPTIYARGGFVFTWFCVLVAIAGVGVMFVQGRMRLKAGQVPGRAIA